MERNPIGIKKSAGGFETTTADSNFASRIIAFCALLNVAIVHYAAMLAIFLRGLA